MCIYIFIHIFVHTCICDNVHICFLLYIGISGLLKITLHIVGSTNFLSNPLKNILKVPSENILKIPSKDESIQFLDKDLFIPLSTELKKCGSENLLSKITDLAQKPSVMKLSKSDQNLPDRVQKVQRVPPFSGIYACIYVYI